MTRQELLNLISVGEGPGVEFQRSLGRDFGRELCAFANGDGGTILLGVSKSGEVTGVGNHVGRASRRSALPGRPTRMTNAGALLLARDIRQFTESAYVSCALFQGTEEAGSLEREDFHGSLPEAAHSVGAGIACGAGGGVARSLPRVRGSG